MIENRITKEPPPEDHTPVPEPNPGTAEKNERQSSGEIQSPEKRKRCSSCCRVERSKNPLPQSRPPDQKKKKDDKTPRKFDKRRTVSKPENRKL